MIDLQLLKRRLIELGISQYVANYYITESVSRGTLENLVAQVERQEHINKELEKKTHGEPIK